MLIIITGIKEVASKPSAENEIVLSSFSDPVNILSVNISQRSLLINFTINLYQKFSEKQKLIKLFYY